MSERMLVVRDIKRGEPEYGSCNFCTRENLLGVVTEISSNDPMRGLSVRLCGQCATELLEAMPP